MAETYKEQKACSHSASSPARRVRVIPLRQVTEAVGEAAADLQADRFALVPNPEYIWAPFELYPLAPRRDRLSEIRAVVMDMDGTTTTTEPLCLHSLEHTVRVAAGWKRPEQWGGFDPAVDLPHLIGDSTTRHVEYLVSTFQGRFDSRGFGRAFLFSCAWTLSKGKDRGRKREVRNDLEVLGCGELASQEAFLAWGRSGDLRGALGSDLERASELCARRLQAGSLCEKVRAAVAIYYQRYHALLEEIDRGGGPIMEQLTRGGEGHLIAPMPFVGAFLSMVKGVLGQQASRLREAFGLSTADCPAFQDLCKRFEARPAKVALVTSSIEYEAGIVLREVFRLLREEVSAWPVERSARDRLDSFFAGPSEVYDAVLTAGDSSEIRLKPHRDLYALALRRLGLHRDDYQYVLGLEDSSAGTVAMKSAGCGLAVALPFEGTAHHDFQAADHVLHGGLKELVCRCGCFLAL